MSKAVAIVTGASQGIGQSTAIRLSRDFSSIVLVARNRENLCVMLSFAADWCARSRMAERRTFTRNSPARPAARSEIAIGNEEIIGANAELRD